MLGELLFGGQAQAVDGEDDAVGVRDPHDRQAGVEDDAAEVLLRQRPQFADEFGRGRAHSGVVRLVRVGVRARSASVPIRAVMLGCGPSRVASIASARVMPSTLIEPMSRSGVRKDSV